jgi:predicted RNase H-like nuclease (RuvC/YqgF family)
MTSSSRKPSRHFLHRWILGLLAPIVNERLEQLEQQVQRYQQENQVFQQQLQAQYDQIQRLAQDLLHLERCIQAPAATAPNWQQMERQLSRLWQYYQDAKEQFDHIQQHFEQQRFNTEAMARQVQVLSDRQQSDLRELQQRLNHLSSVTPLHSLSSVTKTPDLRSTEPFRAAE